MADRVKGSLRTRQRAGGMTYLWCYQRLRPSDGEMVENSVSLGLVDEIGDETAAWRLVGELGLVDKYIAQALSTKPTFGELCAAYVKDGLPFRKKDGRRKSTGTIETYEYHIKNLILPRWREDIAADMKPLAIRNWLYDLHDGDDYRWETCSRRRESCQWSSISLTITKLFPSGTLWTKSPSPPARRTTLQFDCCRLRRSSL